MPRNVGGRGRGNKGGRPRQPMLWDRMAWGVRRLSGLPWKIIGAASTLAGLVGFYLGMKQGETIERLVYTTERVDYTIEQQTRAQSAPRFSLTPQEPLVSSDVFTTPFILTNEGLVSVHDVIFHCGINKVRAGTYEVLSSEISYVLERTIETFGPGQSETIACGFPVNLNNLPIDEADIELIVKYKFSDRREEYERRFRYVSYRDEQGRLRFLPEVLGLPGN